VIPVTFTAFPQHHKPRAHHMTAPGDNQLKSIVSRINTLMDEKKEISDSIGEVYLEAKSNGFDVPALRAIVKAQREDVEKRQAREAQIELYRSSLGIE
jgi:uncharacterized protein (UPF0335 family)